jgi:hypothetical protein
MRILRRLDHLRKVLTMAFRTVSSRRSKAAIS